MINLLQKNQNHKGNFQKNSSILNKHKNNAGTFLKLAFQYKILLKNRRAKERRYGKVVY